VRTSHKLLTILAGQDAWAGVLSAIAPTGSEKLADGNFDGVYTAGVAASWNTIGSPTPTQETTIVHTPGGSAQKITASGSDKGIIQAPSLSLGIWHLVTLWVYHESGQTHISMNNTNQFNLANENRPGNVQGSWLPVAESARVTTASSVGPMVRSFNAAATYEVDDASMLALTLSTLIQTRMMANVNGIYTTNITRVTNTQAGIVHYANATNMVIAYLDGVGNVKVDKLIAGTWTNVASVAITYVAAAPLVVQRAGAIGAGTYAVTYNGTPLTGSPFSITDAIFETAKSWGRFSTLGETWTGGAGNTFGTDTWGGPHSF
jgi:hypothetical protein